MPVYQYVCKDEHLTETFLTVIPDVVIRVIKCGTCGKNAEKIWSQCAVLFQPYAFYSHGYMSHKDRMDWMANPNLTDYGAAHKDLKREGKDAGSRQWTDYSSGGGTKRIRSDKVEKVEKPKAKKGKK